MSRKDAYAAFAAALIHSLEHEFKQPGGATGLRAVYSVLRRPNDGASI